MSREFIPEIRDYLQLYLDLMAFLLRLAGWLDILGLKNSPQFIGECGYNQALINLLHKIRALLVEGGVQARGVHVLVRHGWEQKLGLKETFFPYI